MSFALFCLLLLSFVLFSFLLLSFCWYTLVAQLFVGLIDRFGGVNEPLL